MAERRGRRLDLSWRLFFFGEDDFEGVGSIHKRLPGDIPCPGASRYDAPFVSVPSRPEMAAAHRRSPGAVGQKDNVRSRIYRDQAGPTRTNTGDHYKVRALRSSFPSRDAR